MKAIILNSGRGSRMGDLTSNSPKCLTPLFGNDTILRRQLTQLIEAGIDNVIITTGEYDAEIKRYCELLELPINIIYVKNELYDTTNYIYSLYCARDMIDEDIILMHGDLVFEQCVLDEVIANEKSCMVVSSTLPLPEKDFKATIVEGRISAVGIEFFNDALAAQPLYKIKKSDALLWFEKIAEFCENGNNKCYAENAFNEISDECLIYPHDILDKFCSEIDTPEDLERVDKTLKKMADISVYMCFSTDMLHSGHIAIINKAKKLGKLIIGVLSDEAVSSYKRFPMLPFSERKSIIESIVGVEKVVEQKTLSYKDNLLEFKPDFVVHGDDWKANFQKPIRDEVIEVLSEFGGKLIEFPYSRDDKYEALEKRARMEMATPDVRRGMLRKMLGMKNFVNVIEAHSGITGLLAENTLVYNNGETHQFDAMWVSSLCDSTAKGKPDIELVDMTSRFRTIDDIMEVTTKPIIFDGDTGGLTEHFVYTVRSLERMGVSMVIIEDKTGLKKNSLFGTEVEQTQADISEFCEKIIAGKKAQKTKEFMICARIESLILEKGMEDALERAFAFSDAGADAIMIHSRKKEADEIFEFVGKFREKYPAVPIVVVPTSFNHVTEEEFKKVGVNIVIYANQLTRTSFPAMQNAAQLILKNGRAKECDDICMPISEIIRLIPEDI